MKTRMIFIAVYVLLILLLMNFVGCNSVKSPINSNFTVVVTGPEGIEYCGFCTYEVEYIGDKCTEETDISGKIGQDNESNAVEITATEISCRIDNLTPERPMKVILLKDGAEIKQVESEGEQYDFYIDYYPSYETSVDNSE